MDNHGADQGTLFAELAAPRAIDAQLARCETDWQRAVIAEWDRRHPAPVQMNAGHLGWIDLVPTPCHCAKCDTPALIIPDIEIFPARGYTICPRCSAQTAEALP